MTILSTGNAGHLDERGKTLESCAGWMRIVELSRAPHSLDIFGGRSEYAIERDTSATRFAGIKTRKPGRGSQSVKARLRKIMEDIDNYPRLTVESTA
jgi:hypothetical protein